MAMTGLPSAKGPGYGGTIVNVPGITAGHWTDLDAATGCTVIMCAEGPDSLPTVGGVAVRGGSPGTRETDLLDPIRRVNRVHAVVLSGGSAFGLAAANGAQRWLEERGIGFETQSGRVPIVPAAILYDLGVGRSDVRPDMAAGYAACDAALMGTESGEQVAVGSVGAGAGATVAKAFGLDRAVKGGVGSACCVLSDGVAVGAVVAVNAVGGIWDHRDGSLIAGPRRRDGSMADPVEVMLTGEAAAEQPPGSESGDKESGLVNTTIGVVATDAGLDKMQANFVASSAHDGLALAIRPCHTPTDGDTLFCLATGRNPAPADLMAIVTAATQVTALAVIDAVQSATGLGGVPALGELSEAGFSGF